MANKEKNTFCVTCHTELPPGTEIKYFAQSPLRPHKGDLGFGKEIFMMLDGMKGLFDAVGYGENADGETDEELVKLGYEVALEAQRCMRLLQDAYLSLEARWDKARTQLGEEEAT